MSRHATYEVIDDLSTHLVIRDVGFHDRQLTITNDAEWVVEQLTSKLVADDKRLFVYDSNGDLDEFIWHVVQVKARYGSYPSALFVRFKYCPINHHLDLPEWLRQEERK